jgi:hypothetical protein
VILISNNNSLKQTFRCLSIIDKLGYFSLPSNVDKILYKSISDSLEKIGKSFSKALVHNMCSLHGLSENELLMNYDLFEKTLYSTIGEGAATRILNEIKKELFSHAILNGSSLTAKDILNPELTINDILKNTADREILKFVSEIPAHEHILFLYRNESSKDELLSAFFNASKAANIPTCLLSAKPRDDNLVSNNILYDELFDEFSSGADKEELSKKLYDWLSNLCLPNKPRKKNTTPTRIAEEDATCWIKKGFANELIRLEQIAGKHLDSNLIVLCGFNISKLADKDINAMMETIISCHGYVIIDEPFRVYVAEPDKIEVQQRTGQGDWE